MPTRREKGRNGQGAAEAREHRQAWKESGLTRQAYAEEAGLATSTFSRWLRKLEKGVEASVAAGRAGAKPAVTRGRGPGTGGTDRAKPIGARLVAVQVAPARIEVGADACAENKKTVRPVEIALPSGIRIRYPAGVGCEELSELVVLLEREC